MKHRNIIVIFGRLKLCISIMLVLILIPKCSYSQNTFIEVEAKITTRVESGEQSPEFLKGFISWQGDHGDLYTFSGLGYDAIGSYCLQQTMWYFNSKESTWNKLLSKSETPTPRTSALTWKTKNTLWLYGGCDINGTEVLEDLWAYDMLESTWSQEKIERKPGYLSGSITWADEKGNLWLFGGQRPAGGIDGRTIFLNEVWMFDTSRKIWIKISENKEQDLPTPRANAAYWIDPSALKIWVYGGIGLDKSGTTVEELSDFWLYSAENNTWEQNKSEKAQISPGPRMFPSFWSSKGLFFLLGGHNSFGSTRYADHHIWFYSPKENSWHILKTNNTVPLIGYGVVAVQHEGSPMFFGGMKLEKETMLPTINTTIWKLNNND